MSEIKLIIITIALSVSTYVAYNMSNEYGWKGDNNLKLVNEIKTFWGINDGKE